MTFANFSVVRPEYDMVVVGRNLKRLREAHHYTVEQIKDYLMLGSVQAVYKYERGQSYPQADSLLALMELYNASIQEIVCEHKEREEDLESSSFFVAISCFMYQIHHIHNRHSCRQPHLQVYLFCRVLQFLHHFHRSKVACVAFLR